MDATQRIEQVNRVIDQWNMKFVPEYLALPEEEEGCLDDCIWGDLLTGYAIAAGLSIKEAVYLEIYTSFNDEGFIFGFDEEKYRVALEEK